MTQEDFARRVLGDFGGEASSPFTDIFQMLLAALPQLIALFKDCQPAELRRLAIAGSTNSIPRFRILDRLKYRAGKTRLESAMRGSGADFTEGVELAICSCTDDEIESLLKTAA